MEAMGDDKPNMFVAQITKQNTGDELEFAFRNGSIWENSSPTVRSHTIAGNDTIYAQFAEFSTSVEFSKNQDEVRIYPNPVNSYLKIDAAGTDNIEELRIYSLVGECVKVQRGVSEGIFVSELKSGIYFIELKMVQGKSLRKQFIKF
jgi:hypothetical protein